MYLPNIILDHPAQDHTATSARPIRLIVTPAGTPDSKGPRFTARLERGEVVVDDSRQPMVDSARVLLERGYPADALLTMRMAGKGFDSFRPARIAAWAGLTYHESATRPLRRERWTPFAGATGRQKGPSAGPAAVRPARTEFDPAGRRCSATAGRPAGAP